MGGSGSSTGGGWEAPSVEHLQTLLPQYEISRMLGLGGMGAVYEGVQSNLDRKVAIKILPETLGEEDEGLNFTERFKLEAKSMANLDHPGIISVYEFGQTSEGQLFFVMEFIDGMDIHQYLQHHGGRLPPESAIAITAHVLDALDYAHSEGIIHRDIKPANVMIKSDGRVKVADFGLVKRLTGGDEGAESIPALTMTNMAIGTPDFVAPESLESDRTVDHRADLYAVGVMLYQMLTGALPRGNFRPPSGRVEGLDPRLDDVVSKAMESDPDHRYANAIEFRSAIDQILAEPVPVGNDTGPVMTSGRKLNFGPSDSTPADTPNTGVSPGARSAPPRSRVPRHKQTRAEKNPVVITIAVSLSLLAVGGGALFLKDRNSIEEDSRSPSEPTPSTQAPQSTKENPAKSSTSPDNPTPAQAAEAPTAPDFAPIDLIPLVDLDLTPEHRLEDGAIRSSPNPGSAPLIIAQKVPAMSHGGYRLEMEITAELGNGFGLSLPSDARRVVAHIDTTDNSSSKRVVSINATEGNLLEGSKKELSANLISGAKTHHVVAHVLPDQVALDVDGERQVSWQGNRGDMIYDWAPVINGRICRGLPLINFFGPYVIHSMRLLPAKQTPGKPAPDQPAEAPTTADFSPIDLIPLVDFDLTPEHRLEDGAIQSSPSNSSPPLLVSQKVPAMSHGGYRLEMEITAKQGNGFLLSLPIGDRRILAWVDTDDNSGSQRMVRISVPEGQESEENGKELSDVLITADKKHRLVAHVLPDQVRLDVDGKRQVSWQGNRGDLAFDWAPMINGRSSRGLPLIDFFGPYAVHSLRLLPAIATPRKAPTTADFSPIDLLPLVDLNLSPEHKMVDGTIRCARNRPLLVAQKTPRSKVGGFRFEMEISSSQANGFSFALPWDDRRIQFYVDWTEDPSRKGRITRLEVPKGQESEEHQKETKLLISSSSKQPHKLVVHMTTEMITLEIDEERIVTWKGDLKELKYDWDLPINGHSSRGMPTATFFGDYVIHSMRLLPAGQATPQ